MSRVKTRKRAVRRPKLLAWGQTPWDGLSKEELLKEVWRMYVALQGALGIVNQYRHLSSHALFWTKEGRGGATLEESRQALARLNRYDSESVYRSFFRYASDLLFDANGYDMITWGWHICPKCRAMWGSKTRDMSGQQCTEMPGGARQCDGVLRPLQWSDLRGEAATG